jgi:ribosome-associated toxin RatA of RatAB toxin-antitoxin module
VTAKDLVMVPNARYVAAAGRISARRLFICVALAATTMTAAASDNAAVAVTEQAGTYRVTATFAVSEPAPTAMAVLTDFERIPKYMPDMKTSTVLERGDAGLLVEQEAVARFMMFSKRVHLVLRVIEETGVIRFRDECKKSFEVYDGSWTVRPAGNGATITYQLDAKPSFDVPAFVLRRLLKRDATELIARIRNEIRDRHGR